MRAMAKIGALIAAALGAGGTIADIRQKTKLGDRRITSYFRRARRGGGNNGRYTLALRAKFAKKALERYGLDELTPEGRPNPENVRAMRNARKKERRLAARPRKFWAAVGKYITRKYDERNLP